MTRGIGITTRGIYMGLIVTLLAAVALAAGPADGRPSSSRVAPAHPDACLGVHRKELSDFNRRATRRIRGRHRRCHARLDNTVGPEYFATNAQFLFERDIDAEPEPLLRSIDGAGMTEVRHGALWHTIERTPPTAGVHRYNWRGLDRVVEQLAGHELRLYSLLSYGARWASPQPLHPSAWRFAPNPEYFDDWAAWGAAWAKRYGRDGEFWREHPELPYLPVTTYEIWNETNYSPFAFRDRPADYADLYMQAYDAIKAVDPKAEIVFTAHGFPNVGEWLPQVVAAEPRLADVVDVAAVHLYGRTAEDSLERLAEFRRVVDRDLGPDVELAITEDGTAQYPENDEVKAEYLRTMALSLPRSGCGVSNYMLHTWWTSEFNRNDPEDFYGVATANGHLRGSGRAFVKAARRMQGEGGRRVPLRTLGICE